MKRSFSLALLVALLAASTGYAQRFGGPRDSSQAAPANDVAVKLLTLKTRHVPAVDTADTIANLFRDEQMRVVANPLANTLFIRATPEICQQILEVVESLDRPPATVAIQAIVIRGGHEQSKQLAAVEAMSGDELLTAIGKFELSDDFEVERFKITSLENISSTVEVDNRQPQAGVDDAAGVIVQYTNVGNQLSATHRVSGDRIAIDLGLEKRVTMLVRNSRGPVGTSTLAVNTTVQVPNGGAVVVQSAVTDESDHFVVVVAAKVVEP